MDVCDTGVDGGGAQSSGFTEVRSGLAGAATFPDHAQACTERPALLQSSTTAQENRGAGETLHLVCIHKLLN